MSSPSALGKSRPSREVLQAARRTVRIVCNLTMGGTNPRVIEEFIAEGIQVKHNPTLHSKVYWTDKGVVLGSANASSSGLSLEGREQEGWLEAAIFSNRESETDMTHNYVNDIWCHSEEITDPILKEACKNWRRRRPLPAPDSNLAFMSMLKEGRFSGRKYNIYIALDGGVLTDPEDAEEQAEELQHQFLELQGRDVQPWEGWNDIPREQYIISYSRDPREGLTYMGVWKTLPGVCDRPGPAEWNYQFAYLVNEGEIGMTEKQLCELTRILRCVIRDHHEWIRDQEYRICLDRLLDPQVANCLE